MHPLHYHLMNTEDECIIDLWLWDIQAAHTHTHTKWYIHLHNNQGLWPTWAPAHAEKTGPLWLSSSLHCLQYNWLKHCFTHIHRHASTHKRFGTWVSASVLMNLSPGGGARVMSHTKSSRWAAEPTRGQQINLHYISISTIRLMREGLCPYAWLCKCVCRLSWHYCITN